MNCTTFFVGFQGLLKTITDVRCIILTLTLLSHGGMEMVEILTIILYT